MTQESVLAQPTSAAASLPEGAPSAAGREFGIWPVDESRFSTHRISRIRHNFHQHPNLQLPQLAELARELQPAGHCRYLLPGSTQASEFIHESTSYDGRDIDEVFRRIEQPGSWVALYNIETVPRYREFLDEMIDTIRPLVEREQPEIVMITGFIFISAPPSVTPFHIDRENNFWLQVKGRKTITVWDHTDREIIPEDDVENFIVFRSLDRVRLKDEFRARGQELDSAPGDGVYFPSTTPHMTRTTTDWVTPTDGVSISIGVTFYTSITRRHALVYQYNRLLRRCGLDPTPPGRFVWLDILKAPLGRGVVAIQKWRKGYVAPPGAS